MSDDDAKRDLKPQPLVYVAVILDGPTEPDGAARRQALALRPVPG